MLWQQKEGGFKSYYKPVRMEKTDDKEKLEWFALSAPHRREMEAQRLLEKNNVRCFIPMITTVVTIGNKKQRRLVPAISNLVFAQSTREKLQEIKQGIPYIQYKVNTEEGRHVPIIVPDRQMDQFIAISQINDDRIIYLSPDEINLSKGTRVRIIGGAFNNIEGVFIKIKGKRSKRVVVMVSSIAAVATAEIEPEYIQVLKD